MGRFHDRMDEDLRIRGYSANTRACYLRCVRHCVRHFMRPPDQLTPEHIRRYQLHLTRDRHVSWTYFNQIVCALRFFYRQVLKTDWAVAQIPYQRTGHTLPEILSPEEVAALLRATPNLKHRALLMTMYAGGLRVSEVTHLRVTDIDGQRMVIRIEQGKGRKDRYVMLSPHLLHVLHAYWRARRPRPLLFPGPTGRPLTRESVNRVFHQACRRAKITKHVSPSDGKTARSATPPGSPPSRPRSSCAASCCTSCRTASCASATMAGWPTPRASASCPRSVRCWCPQPPLPARPHRSSPNRGRPRCSV